MIQPRAIVPRAAFLAVASALSLMALSPLAHAELSALEDDMMSDVTGQAMFYVNNEAFTHAGNNYEVTGYHLGLEGDLHINVGNMQLGSGSIRSDLAHASTAGLPDIEIDNFALGIVDLNGDNIRRPFKTLDPYLEFIQKDSELVGMRFGFKKAMGYLSGDFKTFSGKLNVGLKENSGSAALSANLGLVSGWSDASGYQNGHSLGSATDVRAQYFGLANGQTATVDGSTTATANGCSLSSSGSYNGQSTCFSLSNLKTIEVGDSANGVYADGFFFSLSNEAVPWAIDLDQSAALASNQVVANRGFWMNIPQGHTTITLNEASMGQTRQRTCFGVTGATC